MFGPGLLATLGEGFYIFQHGPLEAHSLTRQGEQHRRQRKMLNPAFSIAHLREMSWVAFHIDFLFCF